MAEPLAPQRKVDEARILWEIALIYIALGSVARVMSGTGTLGQTAYDGYRSSQLLAYAYYRLMRAVWTGTTLPDRGADPGDPTSLRDLYSEFESLALRSIPESQRAEARRRARQGGDIDAALEGLVPEREDADLPGGQFSTDEDLIRSAIEGGSEGYETTDTADDAWSREFQIAIERLRDSEDYLTTIEEVERKELEAFDEELERLERERAEAERENDKFEERREELSRLAEEDRRRRRNAMARAKEAGVVMRTAQAGARQEINALARADETALGWVRVPHSATPCSFCLMLASRGIVLYKSKESANDSWHENCHCTSEPVFDREHYFTSDAFAKNRALHKMWDEITGGRGSAALPEWRSHFNKLYANGNSLSGVLEANRKQFQ